jgi:hypothetical protein
MTVLDSTGATQTVYKPAAGQGAMAGIPCVSIASDQSPVPISFISTVSSGLNFQTPPVVPTIQAAAYAIGNNAGGLQTVTFFRALSNFSGRFKGLSLIWLAGQLTPVTFYVFSKNPSGSTFTDKSAFTIANADIKNLICDPITLTPYTFPGATGASGETAQMDISIVSTDTTPGRNLYVAIEIGGAVTPAVGDLVFRMQGTLD